MFLLAFDPRLFFFKNVFDRRLSYAKTGLKNACKTSTFEFMNIRYLIAFKSETKGGGVHWLYALSFLLRIHVYVFFFSESP